MSTRQDERPGSGRPPATVGPAGMCSLSDRPQVVADALAVLGLPADATLEDAGRRYRTLMWAAHPDLHRRGALERARATERAATINAAWAVVRPAAQALERHRRAVAEASRRRHGADSGGPAEATARVIPARSVELAEPRLIPVPDGAALHRGAA